VPYTLTVEPARPDVGLSVIVDPEPAPTGLNIPMDARSEDSRTTTATPRPSEIDEPVTDRLQKDLYCP
jgi:hypothetical protein